MTTLATADIHASANPRDSYRWIFLEQTLPAMIAEHAVERVLVLGDLTEQKSGHSPELVNRLVDAFVAIAERAQVYILRGNHDCCSSDTELLTKRGWLYIDDVRNTDEVLGFDTTTRSGVWQLINEIIRRKTNELYEACGRGYDISVTKHHRVLTHRRGRYHYNPPEQVPPSHQILHAVQVVNEDFPLTDDELRLAAWIVTDGSIDKWGYIHLYQSKYVDQIDDLLRRLKISARRVIRQRNQSEICGRQLLHTPLFAHEWHLRARDSKSILERLSIDKNRNIPLWILDLSKRQFEIFLETVIAADGNIITNKKGRCFAIHKNLQFLSTLQAALACNGMRGTITRNSRGHYILNISTRILSGENHLRFSKRKQSDSTWCLSVGTGNFIVRRNGKVHLTGNCINPDVPFFRYMRHLPRVRWINEPTRLKLRGLGDCLFLPHTKNPEEEWRAWLGDRRAAHAPPRRHDWYFCHQAFHGAVSESGQKLAGVPRNIFPRGAHVVSGDVHKPQDWYVGAPYLIDFGDDYEPRVLLLDGGKMRSVPVPGPQKRLVSIVGEFDERDLRAHQKIFRVIRPGDVVKVRVELPAATKASRADVRACVREWAVSEGVQLYGPEIVAPKALPERAARDRHRATDEELVRGYAKKMGQGKVAVAAGLKIMEETS